MDENAVALHSLFISSSFLSVLCPQRLEAHWYPVPELRKKPPVVSKSEMDPLSTSRSDTKDSVWSVLNISNVTFIHSRVNNVKINTFTKTGLAVNPFTYFIGSYRQPFWLNFLEFYEVQTLTIALHRLSWHLQSCLQWIKLSCMKINFLSWLSNP